MYDVIIIGGGAAGMMAAISAAENGASAVIVEKNERLGRKLGITGKGRCNVTNNCDVNTVLENIPNKNNGRFLYGALSKFSPSDTMEFFEGLGVPLKTERGNRVFPVSDKASDIVNALANRVQTLGIDVVRGSVRSLIIENEEIRGVNTHDKQIRGKAVILAAGGASYPRTGSDGFGYKLAEQAGHSVIPPRPSLCPLITEEKMFTKAQGLTLRNISMKLIIDNKTVYEDFGELSFTADGLGGATVLSASAHIGKLDGHSIVISIDLKPALSEKQLDARILRDFSELRGKNFSDSLRKLMPKELCEPFCEFLNITPDKKIGEITKLERKTLVNSLKSLNLTVKSFRPIDEAIVTRGGISLKEISPKDMSSRLIRGLFLAGEVIDADAYTGGFNLQIAFSTGRLAGISAAEFVKFL